MGEIIAQVCKTQDWINPSEVVFPFYFYGCPFLFLESEDFTFERGLLGSCEATFVEEGG